jgi:hypothetical protein
LYWVHASVLIAAMTFSSCSGPQQRPENFPEAAFRTWQERYPEGRFESYAITTQSDGNPNLYMLEVEEGDGRRYLTMYEDGTVIEDRYVEELYPEELPKAVTTTIKREYPGRDVIKSILIVRNDTTEYLVNVELESREDLPQYNFYDNLLLSPKGEIKKRTNVATTEEE